MVKKTNYNYDVAVVGAGPAGSTAGYILSKKGYKVLILDKEKFPRKKLCGGTLTAKTIRLLDKIFSESEDSLTRKKIIDFKSNRYEISYKNEILINKESAYIFCFIDRYVYDDFLLQKAKQAGADVMEGEKVEEVDTEKNELSTSGGRLIKAGFIIGADGANSILRAGLFREGKLDGTKWQHNLGYALEVFIDRRKDFEALDYPILSYGYLNYGYAWIFPNKNRLVVGIGGLKRKNKKKDITVKFKTFLSDFKLAAARHPLMSRKIQGHPLPFGNFLSKPAWRKILLVGDAAGLVDPMLGEGIYQAHKSGELAAQAIIENTVGSATPTEPTPPLRGTPPGEGISKHYIDSSLKDLPVHSPLERGGPPQADRGVFKYSKKSKIFPYNCINNIKNLEECYLNLLNTHLIPEFIYARRFRWFAYNRLNHILKFRSVKLVESRFEKLVELVHGDRSYRKPWRKKRS